MLAGTYFFGDAAFDLSENLITPFTCSMRGNLLNGSFNVFLSQARIRIEMPFARLSGRFSCVIFLILLST